MAIRGAEYAVARIIAVLQANLAAELVLIDAEEADGVTMEDIEVGAYFAFETDAATVTHTKAIVVNVSGSDVVQEDSTSNSPGRMWQEHDIEVAVHVKDVENETSDITKKRVLRYARAIERILSVKLPTLSSGGVEQVFRCRRLNAGKSRYIDPDDQTGEMGRTARIPFIVTTVENL